MNDIFGLILNFGTRETRVHKHWTVCAQLLANNDDIIIVIIIIILIYSAQVTIKYALMHIKEMAKNVLDI